MRYFAATLLLVGFLSLGCNRPNNPAPAVNSPTNTGVNSRDAEQPRAKEPVTGQDENSADVKTTAEIRQKIVNGSDFGVNARNVKIMTSKGMVTLRGPVDTAAEKDRIDAIAKEVAGAANVTNEIDVANAAIKPNPPGNPTTDPKDAPKVLPETTPPAVPPTNPPAPPPAPGTEPAVKPETKS